MPGWPSAKEIDARVRAWLAEHWKDGCPTCGGTKYAVADQLMVSLPIRNGVLRPLDTFVGQPYAQALCEACGFVVHVSSSVLKLTGGK